MKSPLDFLKHIPERFRDDAIVQKAAERAAREAERQDALAEIAEAEAALATTMPPLADRCRELETKVRELDAAHRAALRELALARSTKLGAESLLTQRIDAARALLNRTADPRVAELIDALDATIEDERHPRCVNSDDVEAGPACARRIAQLTAARHRASELYYVADPRPELAEIENVLALH